MDDRVFFTNFIFLCHNIKSKKNQLNNFEYVNAGKLFFIKIYFIFC